MGAPDMSPAVAQIGDDVDSRMREWRHRFHANPELAFDVQATAAVVADALLAAGIEDLHTGIGRTGIVASIRQGTSTRAIGLRADMDALPIQEGGDAPWRSTNDGIFHGCGHDGHTAMLLGAAVVLAGGAVSFDGTVHLIFQPDEENGRGAQAMIDDGLFDRFPVDAVYGLHNKPGIPAGQFATRVGPMMSSEDLFEITIQGRGGHASMPETHIDPVIVAAEIISALQTIVARAVRATEAAVVSVTDIVTDGARNIVPSRVIISGDCRSFSADVQTTIETRMRTIVEGICLAHGATATITYRHEFVPTVNTVECVDAAVATATAVVGADAVDADRSLVMASEDFARMLAVVPGCYIDLGNGIDGACGSTLHNPHYDFNDDVLRVGAAYWVRLVQDQLT